MVRNYKKLKTSSTTFEQCKFCLKSFRNIQSHYYQNNICAEFNLNHNLTLAGHINAIQSPTNPLSLATINDDTYSFFYTNDMDDICFETQLPIDTDIQEPNTELLINSNSNQIKKPSNTSNENSTNFDIANLIGLI